MRALGRTERGANAAIDLLTYLAITGAALYGVVPTGLHYPVSVSAPSSIDACFILSQFAAKEPL